MCVQNLSWNLGPQTEIIFRGYFLFATSFSQNYDLFLHFYSILMLSFIYCRAGHGFLFLIVFRSAMSKVLPIKKKHKSIASLKRTYRFFHLKHRARKRKRERNAYKGTNKGCIYNVKPKLISVLLLTNRIFFIMCAIVCIETIYIFQWKWVLFAS